MITGKEFLTLGKWVLALRIIQLVLAVVVLGCSAFGVYYVAYNAYCLSLFTAIAAIITSVYIIVAETAAKKAYNFWALLALDIFNIIFWLCSFALLADLLVGWIGDYDSSSSGDSCYYSSDYSTYTCYKKRNVHSKRDTTYADYENIIIVTLTFSVIEFLLYITTLVVLSIAIHRHRKSTTSAVTPEVNMEAATKEEETVNTKSVLDTPPQV